MHTLPHQLLVRASAVHMFKGVVENCVLGQSTSLTPNWHTAREVVQLGIQSWLAIPAQVIPIRRERPYSALLGPREVKQRILGVLHQLRRQDRTGRAIEQHRRGPLEWRLFLVHQHLVM